MGLSENDTKKILPPDFVVVPYETQALFAMLSDPIKRKILGGAFRRLDARIGVMNVTASGKKDALLYLVSSKRDQMIKYVEDLGLRYEPTKGSKGLILFDDIPKQVDLRLLETINKYVGIAGTSEVKNVLKKKKSLLKFGLPLSGDLLEKFSQIAGMVQEFNLLVDSVKTEAGSVSALDHLVKMSLQASIHQNAGEIAIRVATEITQKGCAQLSQSALELLIKESIIGWFKESSSEKMN